MSKRNTKQVPNRQLPKAFEGYVWKADDEDGYWVNVGMFRTLKATENFDAPAYGEKVVSIRFKAPFGATSDQVKEAVHGKFDGSCECAHDCCGCYCGIITNIKRVKRREYTAVIHVMYNN